MTIDKAWDLEKIKLVNKYPLEDKVWLFLILFIVVGLLLLFFLADSDLEINKSNRFIKISTKILQIMTIALILLTLKSVYDSSKFRDGKDTFFEKNEDKIMKYVDVETYNLVPFIEGSKTNYFVIDIPGETVRIQYKTEQGNKMETLAINEHNTYFNSLEKGHTPELKIKEKGYVNNKLKKEFEYRQDTGFFTFPFNYLLESTREFDRIYVFYVSSEVEFDLNKQQYKDS